MKKRNIIFILLSVLTLGLQGARAEDDLLNILNGSADDKSANAMPGEMQKSENEVSKALHQLLPQATAEQTIFINFMKQNELEKALYQWPVAFDEDAFAKSANGHALYAYLLYRSGLTVVGLENLFAIDHPETISPVLMKWWKAAAPDTEAAWTFAILNWKPFWSENFGVATEVRSQAHQILDPQEITLVQEMIKKTTVNTRERAMLEWQLVLGLSLSDQAGMAAKTLNHLMQAQSNPIGSDLMLITAARLLYQNGYLDAAIKYYEKIPKKSDYWFDAQEEIAWANIRKGEPQNSIAITKSLVVPAFQSLVGPEPVYLRSLSLLKVCDYPGVVDTLNMFRERYKPRAKAMLELSENAGTPAVKSFIAKSKKSHLTLLELGADAAVLPRFITRDEMLLQQIETERELEREAKLASELYARSLSGGTGQVGFQARLEGFKQLAENRVMNARSATLNRVKSLAQEEVTEITQLLQKLHIVETEVLQQIATAERVIQASSQKVQLKDGSTGSHSRDQLTFPAENETWFDELSNYKVDIKKGCQAINK